VRGHGTLPGRLISQRYGGGWSEELAIIFRY
jgi:hypothetical protein